MCLCVCIQASAYLIPEELFKMELEEGVERVQITISVLRTLKQLFHSHRQRIPKYYRHSQDVKLWDFPATLVFQRSDRIMERLLMIEVHEMTSIAPFLLVYRKIRNVLIWRLYLKEDARSICLKRISFPLHLHQGYC